MKNKTVSTDTVLFPFFHSESGVVLWHSIYFHVLPAIESLAIMTNTINVLAFVRSGTKDGISIIFLSLSISDLLYNLVWLIVRALAGAEIVYDQHPYHQLRWTAFFLSRSSQIWYVISVSLTIFAAVQKCSCIALPLVFSHYFTRRRTAAVVITVFVITIIYNIPGLSLYRWKESFDYGRNRTRLSYGWANRPLGLKLNIIMDWINLICMPFISEGVIVVCVIIMTVKLRQAAVTRLAMTAVNTHDASVGHQRGKKNSHLVNTEENVTSSSMTQSTGSRKAHSQTVSHEANSNPKSQTVQISWSPESNATLTPESERKLENVAVNSSRTILNPRELRVIHSANLICVIFLLGTLSYLVVTTCSLVFRSTFSDFGEEALYFTIRGIQEIIYASSTAANMVVYYKFNSKYKKEVDSMFSCLCT